MEQQSERSILIVEDEPSISGFIRRGLIFEGYSVEAIDDGRAGLERLRDQRPDLLILDLMLPGIDGLEICRRVRAAEAADGSTPLPILMLTARDAVNDRVTGLEAGADDYLVKPFAFSEFLARVRTLLRRVKAVGAREVEQRRPAPFGRTAWQAVTARYEQLREPEGLPLTYDVVWLIAHRLQKVRGAYPTIA